MKTRTRLLSAILALVMALTFVLALGTTALAEDQDTVRYAEGKVGEALNCGTLAYGVTGWNSASGVLNNPDYPNTLAEYGLSGGYSSIGFTPSGTPTKAGTATYTVELVYSDYSVFVTYKIKIAAAATAPIITAQPRAVNAKPGDTVTFTVAASGEALRYQWYLQTGSSAQKVGTDSASLTLTNVDVSDKDMACYCVVSNTLGSVTSDKARLTVSEQAYVFPFTDVPTSAWYYTSVKDSNQMGLINGKTATLFKPADNMTVAEALKLAACMHQLYQDGAVTLTNGSANWYSTYYEYCRANNIIQEVSNEEAGYYDLLNRANEKITRLEYVLIFSRALPDSALSAVNTIPDNSIPDVEYTNSVYNRAVYKLYRAGILNGSDAKGAFKPDNYILRSEVAAILIRMMDSSVRVGAPSELGK